MGGVFKRGAGVAAMVLMLATAGCARIAVQDQLVRLTDQTNAYAKAIRWNEFGTARQFVRPRDGAVPSYDEDLLRAVRVTTMDIKTRAVIKQATEAIVSAEITYYHAEQGSLRTITDRQTWWFDEQTRKWFIDGALPDFAAGLAAQ